MGTEQSRIALDLHGLFNGNAESQGAPAIPAVEATDREHGTTDMLGGRRMDTIPGTVHDTQASCPVAQSRWHR